MCGSIASLLGSIRGSSGSFLALPQQLERLSNATLPCFVAFGFVDPAGVLLAVGVGELFEAAARPRIVCERIGQCAGNLDFAGRGVELELDLDGVAGFDAGSLAYVAIEA